MATHERYIHHGSQLTNQISRWKMSVFEQNTVKLQLPSYVRFLIRDVIAFNVVLVVEPENQ